MSFSRKIYSIMKNSHILKLYERLADDVESLHFSPPVSHVYNPLRYAWDGFSQYLAKCPEQPRVVFLGMNPGPWGMAQTGVPFGEIDAVRNFLGIHEISITPPENQHPSYPVSGLQCGRSEVSGKRLWGLFRERFGSSEAFFRENIVLNYCPLLFIAEGRNLTPDKLRKSDRAELFSVCDSCFGEVVKILRPEFVVGIGNFAEKRASEALSSAEGLKVNVVKILHPSPASPASNHDWGGKVTHQLMVSGIWQ
ncbi:MAG: hypothetical protein IJS39_07625 [Synergistaceae bacterium]|nr:hypothetical protein [Synergistaceae bacterium]